MKVLLGQDVLHGLFGGLSSKEKLLLSNIVFNSSTKICFSKTYLNLLEKSGVNQDYFQALIKELNDENRIETEKCCGKTLCDDEFKQIVNNNQDSFFIPVVIKDDAKFNGINSLLVLEKSKKNNLEWIKRELLAKAILNVCYKDFNNDNEIKTFFDNLFLIPKFIKEVYVFDREQTSAVLTKAHGNQIKYYTLMGGSHKYLLDRQDARRILRRELGGRLKLFYTSDPRVLHERKILIENLIITIDNSRNNLTISEPTWEITVCIDKTKANDWLQKTVTRSFREQTN